MMMHYTELLTGLGRLLGLSDAARLAETQEIVIGDFTVGFNYEPFDADDPSVGDVAFFSVLGRPLANLQGDIHRLMLEGNNIWAGTRGATLGVQRDGGAVVLAMRLPVETTTPERLVKTLGSFIQAATFWRSVVAGESAALVPSPAASFAAFRLCV